MDDLEQETRAKIKEAVADCGTSSFKWGVVGAAGHFALQLSHWLMGWPERVSVVERWIIFPAAMFIAANCLALLHQSVKATVSEFRTRSVRIDERLKRLEEK